MYVCMYHTVWRDKKRERQSSEEWSGLGRLSTTEDPGGRPSLQAQFHLARGELF